jgi:PAS domain S-box-containing protein
MESAVRESEELFYTLAKLSPVGIFRADALGRYTYVSDHWRTITGLSLAQALHDRWQTGIHPGDRERVRAAWQQAVHGGAPFRSEHRFRRPDGTVRWVLGQALPEIDGEGDFRGHVGTITDITDRKQAERALVESERGKGEAARRAADTERRRLARELHDGALQDLGAVKLSLEVERKHERNDRIGAAIERLTAVITELRTVVENLQPGDLSRASLHEAIAAHAKWLSGPYDITLTLDLDPEVSVARAGTRGGYRIAQEALANAVQHGNATRITVRLAARSSAFVLEVEDDGVGFDANAPSHGMGLVNMRERAAALGGDLHVTSIAGQGTRVHVIIPESAGHGIPGSGRGDQSEP